ncbi:MAG: VCBS repeat-containing protein [Candidatus Hydrogenedentota bacterium]
MNTILRTLFLGIALIIVGCSNDSQPSQSDSVEQEFKPIDFTFSEKTETLALVLADVDNDDDLDLIEGIAGAPNQLYLNNGSPDPFNGVTPVAITTGNHFTIDVALSDIDLDGDPDYFEATLGANFFRLNNGSFELLPETILNSKALPTYTLAIGDINGDSYPDIIVGNSQKNLNQIMLNKTTAPYFDSSEATDLGVDKDTTEEILLADLNKDGHLDLLAVNAGEPNRIYINSGTPPFFAESRDIVPKPYYGFSITTGDVDGDGDLDIVCGNLGQNSLFINNGDTFSSSEFGVKDIITRKVFLEDLNADGRPDLIVANQDAENHIYWNTGTAPFFTLDSSLAFGAKDGSTRAMVIEDVNGDGVKEIIAGNAASQSNRVFSVPRQ